MLFARYVYKTRSIERTNSLNNMLQDSHRHPRHNRCHIWYVHDSVPNKEKESYGDGLKSYRFLNYIILIVFKYLNA
jgi:hypothetical protein